MPDILTVEGDSTPLAFTLTSEGEPVDLYWATSIHLLVAGTTTTLSLASGIGKVTGLFPHTVPQGVYAATVSVTYPTFSPIAFPSTPDPLVAVVYSSTVT